MQRAHVRGDDTGAAIRACNFGKPRQRGSLQRTPFGHGSASTAFAGGVPLGNDLASPKMDGTPPYRASRGASLSRLFPAPVQSSHTTSGPFPNTHCRKRPIFAHNRRLQTRALGTPKITKAEHVCILNCTNARDTPKRSRSFSQVAPCILRCIWIDYGHRSAFVFPE